MHTLKEIPENTAIENMKPVILTITPAAKRVNGGRDFSGNFFSTQGPSQVSCFPPPGPSHLNTPNKYALNPSLRKNNK